MKFRTEHFNNNSHGMNLVPLIDVLLILLIFFIVTFGWSKFETEVEISVPTSETGATAERRAGELVVNLRKDGTIVINSVVTSPQLLLAKLGEIARFNRKQAIIIRGDEATPYSNIFKVLDLCHQSGLFHVSFASQGKSE